MATPEEQAKVEKDEQAKKFEDLAKKLADQTATIAGLQRKLEANERQLLSSDFMDFVEGKKKAEAETPDEEDFDSLTGSQLVARLRKEHQETLAKVEAKYEAKIADLGGGLQRNAAYYDLELTKIRQPKFAKFLETEEGRQKLTKIAQENPSWNAEKIWKQHQLEERLTLETASEEKAKQEKSELATQLEAVGEKGGFPQSSATGKKLTEKEAAEKAFDLAMGAGASEEEPQLPS